MRRAAASPDLNTAAEPWAITRRRPSFASTARSSSLNPSTSAASCESPPRLARGRTAIEGAEATVAARSSFRDRQNIAAVSETTSSAAIA